VLGDLLTELLRPLTQGLGLLAEHSELLQPLIGFHIENARDEVAKRGGVAPCVSRFTLHVSQRHRVLSAST
jgi:hypothetical protein